MELSRAVQQALAKLDERRQESVDLSEEQEHLWHSLYFLGVAVGYEEARYILTDILAQELAEQSS